MTGRNYKKTLVIISVSIVSLIGMIILFISPIIKYLIEKYDTKYIGREVSMDWAYVNPFTGHTYFNDIKIYEYKSDSIFFYADELSINFSINKLFSKIYEINGLTIYRPWIAINQNNKSFNFDDIQKKFTSNKSNANKEPIHFNLLNIKINDGEIHYREEIIPVNYSIKKFNFESSGKKWDVDSISGKLSFISGVGSGEVKSNFSLNLKSNMYNVSIALHKFDLVLIEQYLRELTNYGNFTATADADLYAKGNLNDSANVNITGTLAINDFHFGKNSKEDYASFDKLVVKINELDPKNHRYLFDSLSLIRPFFKYEKYDHLDNLETIFGKKGANVRAVAVNPDRYNLVIEIARSVRILAKKILEGDYKINRIAIYKGDIQFNDYSLSEKFSIGLSPLNLLADSIDKNHQWVNMSLASDIKPYGHLGTLLNINPRDSSDFELAYHFQKIPAAIFNPYLISYTSFPLDRGTLEFKG
ncbi:MAG TPA: DUF748 domain-containing protein, partial [Bacteroidia bacterium]|nr:DUF748 domain-containing protein [Bacteroidia bacterium]